MSGKIKWRKDPDKTKPEAHHMFRGGEWRGSVVKAQQGWAVYKWRGRHMGPFAHGETLKEAKGKLENETS